MINDIDSNKIIASTKILEDTEILILILILIDSNPYKEYYDEDSINLFLETLKSSILKYKFFKLGA